MVSRAQDALRIAERIATLRTELTQLEKTFFDLFGEEPVAASESKATHRGLAVAGSIAERIKATLHAEPARVFALSELVKAMPDVNEKSLRGTASRLASEESSGVQSVSRGRYKAFIPRGPKLASVRQEAAAAE